MKIKLALVDDHPLMLDGMQLGLSRYENLNIIYAKASGLDLITELEATQNLPDVAIIDFQMPDANGFEITQLLQEKFPSIKILIYSFNTEKFIIQRAIHLGAKGFLQKNDTPEEMYKAIVTAYDNKIYTNILLDNTTAVSSIKGYSTNSRFNINAEISEREKEVIIYIAESLTYKEIAKKMNISKRTVETHKERVFEKLGVTKNNDLIIYASKLGWI